MDIHDHDHKHCQCHKQVLPASQSLDELDFLKSACSAAQKGDVHRLRHLLGRHAESVDDDGVRGDMSHECFPSHHSLCSNGPVQCLTLVMSMNSGSTGYTPLHYASRAGQAAAAQLLLDSGVL